MKLYNFIYLKRIFLFCFILSSSTLVLSGCLEVIPKRFIGPNGKTAYNMRCSGMGRTMDKCYQKAGEICRNGYNIIDISSSSFTTPNLSTGGVIVGNKKEMAIECKD